MVRLPPSVTHLVSLAFLVGISACGRHTGASGTAPMAGVSPGWRYGGEGGGTKAPSAIGGFRGPAPPKIRPGNFPRGGETGGGAGAGGVAPGPGGPPAGEIWGR